MRGASRPTAVDASSERAADLQAHGQRERLLLRHEGMGRIWRSHGPPRGHALCHGPHLPETKSLPPGWSSTALCGNVTQLRSGGLLELDINGARKCDGGAASASRHPGPFLEGLFWARMAVFRPRRTTLARGSRWLAVLPSRRQQIALVSRSSCTVMLVQRWRAITAPHPSDHQRLPRLPLDSPLGLFRVQLLRVLELRERG
jgi:hypothetical protein